MLDNSKIIPTSLEIKQIFNETYNVFYRKWINTGTIYDPAVMMQEARELDRKYNH